MKSGARGGMCMGRMCGSGGGRTIDRVASFCEGWWLLLVFVCCDVAVEMKISVDWGCPFIWWGRAHWWFWKGNSTAIVIVSVSKVWESISCSSYIHRTFSPCPPDAHCMFNVHSFYVCDLFYHSPFYPISHIPDLSFRFRSLPRKRYSQSLLRPKSYPYMSRYILLNSHFTSYVLCILCVLCDVFLFRTQSSFAQWHCLPLILLQCILRTIMVSITHMCTSVHHITLHSLTSCILCVSVLVSFLVSFLVLFPVEFPVAFPVTFVYYPYSILFLTILLYVTSSTLHTTFICSTNTNLLIPSSPVSSDLSTILSSNLITHNHYLHLIHPSHPTHSTQINIHINLNHPLYFPSRSFFILSPRIARMKLCIIESSEIKSYITRN